MISESLLRSTTLCVLILGLSACVDAPWASSDPAPPSFPAGTTVDFAFESDGTTLSGVFDVPADEPAQALILFVHGYGNTDVRGRNMYADLRSAFTALGIATATWDKPGQGRSEGTFDINQPVADSAREVLDAARYLRAIKAPGADYIGIWGVSRAGWIAPLAMAEDPGIEFWISVSGVTAEDNFNYLLLANLPYEGGTHEEAALFAAEWRSGCKILRTGGTYERYLQATENLRANAYIHDMRGGWPTWMGYKLQQLGCDAGTCAQVDDDMSSYIHIDDFDALLSSLDVDVLALFGERDRNVDWRKTRALYETTIGRNPDASLVIKSFADADHNLHVSDTGSIKEMQAMTAPRKSDGYLAVQLAWLRQHVLGARAEQVPPR